MTGFNTIANVGECFLQKNRYTEITGREDIKAIGYMMMELMEVKTSVLQPNSVELKNPEAWKDTTGIKDFLASTQHKSLAELRVVSATFTQGFQMLIMLASLYSSRIN